MVQKGVAQPTVVTENPEVDSRSFGQEKKCPTGQGHKLPDATSTHSNFHVDTISEQANQHARFFQIPEDCIIPLEVIQAPLSTIPFLFLDWKWKGRWTDGVGKWKKEELCVSPYKFWTGRLGYIPQKPSLSQIPLGKRFARMQQHYKGNPRNP